MQPPDSPPTTGVDVTDIALASVRFKAGHSGNTISHGSSTGAMNLEHAVASVSFAAEPLTPSASANVTSPIREGEPEAEERDPAHANTPDEQLADVETQLNVMAGGVNQPRDRRVRTTAKSDSNKLYNKPASAVTNEAITDEKMMDLYKAYKGSE